MSTGENKFQRGEWFEGQFYPDDDGDQDEPPAPPRTAIPEPDLQLLELAARALGAVRVEIVEGEQWVNLHFEDGSTVFGWNSLRHSDDAFNLAVDLTLHILPGRRTVVVESADHMVNEDRGRDAGAATRRAVTRAAAEIGKQRSS